MGSEKKVFFFEKKKQKTFTYLVQSLGHEYLRSSKLTKVFCFFFSKKKILPVASTYFARNPPAGHPSECR